MPCPIMQQTSATHDTSQSQSRSRSPTQLMQGAAAVLARSRAGTETSGQSSKASAASLARRETFRKARKTMFEAYNASGKRSPSPTEGLHRTSRVHALHRAVTSTNLGGARRRTRTPPVSDGNKCGAAATARVRAESKGTSSETYGNESVNEANGRFTPVALSSRPPSSALSLEAQYYEVPKRKATARCDVPTEVVVLQPTVHNIRFCQPWLIADRLLTLENCSVFSKWKRSRLSEVRFALVVFFAPVFPSLPFSSLLSSSLLCLSLPILFSLSLSLSLSFFLSLSLSPLPHILPFSPLFSPSLLSPCLVFSFLHLEH